MMTSELSTQPARQPLDRAEGALLVAEKALEEVRRLTVELAELKALSHRGEKGERGDPGDRGEKGDPGRDGIGLAGGMIDRNGIFILTMSDGSVRELGVVVGKDGEPGAPGPAGRDGFGFDDLDVVDLNEREFKMVFSRGEHVKSWTIRKGGVVYRDVYKAGEHYQRNDIVTWGGSVWIAQRDTADKPGNGSDAWKLAVKKGLDGRNGERGPQGDRGPEGRPGRDYSLRPKI